MGRVEKFRQLRITRQKYIISAVIFITLLTVGICTADYSINNLIDADGSLRIFSIRNSGNRVELDFMNQKIEFNLGYVKNDLDKVRQFFAGIFNKDS